LDMTTDTATAKIRVMLRFTKLNGAGNDFILVDNRAGDINLAAIQMDVPCPVVDQDKIISRAVHFRETQHDSDFSGGCVCCHVERARDISYCCLTARDSSTS